MDQPIDATGSANAIGDERTPVLDAQHVVSEMAQRRIFGFEQNIDSEGNYYSNVYRENRSLAAHVTADYHGRFLLELLQNGHDVHPIDEQDGEIEIVLDECEGPHGTLYVANRGVGFTPKNVEAICDIGISSKPPGEAIGNKGLGFRSVHHITDQPEIFSQADPVGMKSTFDGFRFSFASASDLESLISNPDHRNLALQDLPLFNVPIWRDTRTPRVDSFAQRGFATVIRLPIRDSASLSVVREEIYNLTSDGPPILLFLTRLEKVTARIENALAPEQAITSTLVRNEQSINRHSPSVTLVDLKDRGHYLIARRDVDEVSMRTAIASGIESKQLHPSWNGWQGDGEAAIAVRIDGGPVDPRVYTFLPMGKDAEAPFSGYLQGSFFPSSNRKALEPTVALNRLVLDNATSLAAETISWLCRYSSASDRTISAYQLTDEQAACAATDLLVWREVASLRGIEIAKPANLSQKVCAAEGVSSIDEAQIIPCLNYRPSEPKSITNPRSIVWRPAKEARRWTANTGTFTTDVVAEYGSKVGIAPIWPGLNELRIDRLKIFLSVNMKAHIDLPTPKERAGISEQVAATILNEQHNRIRRWTDFYKDLLPFIGPLNLAALNGCQVLFCGDGKIRPVAQPQASDERTMQPRRRRKRSATDVPVFAPPELRPGAAALAVGTDDLTPPKTLAPYFAFLSHDLPWYGELAQARQAFEGKLFHRFDTDNVLTQLSQTLFRESLKELWAAGLKWAYQIWRRARENARPFQLRDRHRFYVPTAEGKFIAARDAIFSLNWPDELCGKKLERFIKLAPETCTDLSPIKARLLAPRTHRAFGRTNDWIIFLSELGVRKGLHPISKNPPSQVSAYSLSTFSFCKSLDISPSAATVWRDDVASTGPHALNLQYTTYYVINGKLWWMPGQGDHETFSNECREIYASLVIEWLEAGDSGDVWDVEIHHQFAKNADSRHWPTPLAAFVRTSCWVPVDEPSGSMSVRRHVPPKFVWVLADTAAERPPAFLTRPAAKIQRALDQSAQAKTKLKQRASLRFFNDRTTLLLQSQFLAEQYHGGHVDLYHEREFLNLYRKTWQLISVYYDTMLTSSGSTATPTLIIASGEGGACAVDMNKCVATDPVYVCDTEDETASNQLMALGYLIVEARATDPTRLGKALFGIYKDKMRLVSQVKFEFLVDGITYNPSVSENSITSLCPWLRILAAVAMQGLHGAAAQRLPNDRSIVLARLDRASLRCATTIAFKVAEKKVDVSDGNRKGFAFKNSAGGAVVVLHQGPLNWDAIDGSIAPLCDVIEQPALIDPMRLLLALVLSKSDEEVGFAQVSDPNLSRMCLALGLDKSAALAARDALGTKLDRHFPWLRAIVHLAGGEDALLEFNAQEANATNDLSELRAALTKSLLGSALDSEIVLQACRSSFTVEQLRGALNLDFAAFNSSLIAVGELPDIDPERHQQQLAAYIAEHKIELVDLLRKRFSATLETITPAPEYAEVRERLSSLKPNSDWLPIYHDLPDEIAEAYVKDWIASYGTQVDGAAVALLPVQKVRLENSKILRTFVAGAGHIIQFWCTTKGAPLPKEWQTLDDSESLVRKAIDEAGAYDFAPLTALTVVKWLAAVGAWPVDMPHSLDPEALGISYADLDKAQSKSDQDREEKLKEGRSVKIGGRSVDPIGADWQALSSEISEQLKAMLRPKTLNPRNDLLPARTKGGPLSRRAPVTQSGSASSRAPQEKRDMIGRLGELIVYHDLLARFPKQDIGKAWRSKNGNDYNGGTGNDSLGFDFEITYNKQPLRIEVKSSTTDPQCFDLGETEVRAAREAALPRSGVRFVIAFVRNVGVTGKTSIEILPNPFSPAGDGVLRIVGEGIRYEYRRP